MNHMDCLCNWKFQMCPDIFYSCDVITENVREREYNMVTWSGFYTKQVIKLLPEDENIQSPLQSKPRFK